jgi:hypothetical protein
MVEIMNVAMVVTYVGRWNPGDLAFIETIEYQCGSDNSDASVLLVGIMQRRDEATSGWPSTVLPSFRVAMLFDGVRELELKRFGKAPTQVMGFDIIDVSDRGWDGIRFLVEDYENGALRLSCHSISILDVVHV